MSKGSIRVAWLNLQRNVVSAWQRRDYEQSLSEIESFLSRRLSMGMKSEVIAYRSHTKELMGLLEDSKKDLLRAHSLSKKSSYGRYTLELSLGGLCEKLEEIREATQWYRTALETSVAGRSYSGGAALRSYMRLVGANFSEADRVLARRVVRRSWKNLGLRESPELDDLSKAGEILKEAERRPR